MFSPRTGRIFAIHSTPTKTCLYVLVTNYSSKMSLWLPDSEHRLFAGISLILVAFKFVSFCDERRHCGRQVTIPYCLDLLYSAAYRIQWSIFAPLFKMARHTVHCQQDPELCKRLQFGICNSCLGRDRSMVSSSGEEIGWLME